jgi:hypothetical protein
MVAAGTNTLFDNRAVVSSAPEGIRILISITRRCSTLAKYKPTVARGLEYLGSPGTAAKIMQVVSKQFEPVDRQVDIEWLRTYDAIQYETIASHSVRSIKNGQ